MVEGDKTEDGTFLKFDPLTLVPIDIRAIDFDLLGNEDIQQLKAYQNLVYEKISPQLSEDEAEWLKGFLVTEYL
ncbi:MAG: M24 family metallopeptidase C-terminal domain-containing protein [Lachnospiraceae bacterium]|nr:M24 family metallopeptidase C-terminal domain-containing protein [Lachnospiraceae bacterium]